MLELCSILFTVCSIFNTQSFGNCLNTHLQDAVCLLLTTMVILWLLKVKLSLCLIIKHHTMKIFASYEGEWSASCSSCFMLGKTTTHITKWIGVWMGSRACMDEDAKRKICPLLGTKPSYPDHNQSLC